VSWLKYNGVKLDLDYVSLIILVVIAGVCMRVAVLRLKIAFTLIVADG
jgi:hypothetical protein